MNKVLLSVMMGTLASGTAFATEASTDTCTATQYGLRTNVLSWVALTPQLDFDFFMGSHWNLSVGGAYGWWGFNGDQHAIQSWKVAASARYYFQSETFRKHSLGMKVETGQFDVRVDTYGRRGPYTTVGLEYAYTWHLGKNSNWFLDAGVGGGFIHESYTKYLPYKPTECYHRVYDKTRNTFGLTNVFINLSYRFPVQNHKKGGEL